MTRPPPYRPFGAFRFALAMMVLLQHGLLLLGSGGRALFYDMELGSVAVVTFFALSGFIVAEALRRFYAGRPVAFLANRIMRVVPPYAAALALTVLVDAWLARQGWLVPLDGALHGSPLQPRVLLAAMLEVVPGLPVARISGQDFSFIPFAWTLRVEFAFYAVACLACWLASRRGESRMAGWLCGAAAYAGFAAFVLSGGHGPLQVICVPFFAFGVGAFLWLTSTGALAGAHLALAACCVLLAFPYFRQHGHPVLGFQLALIVALYAVLLALARIRHVSPGLRRWDQRLGELSYPLYISHGLVLTLLASLSDRRGALPYLAAVPLALGLALVLHAAVEQPLRAVRTRLRGATV